MLITIRWIFHIDDFRKTEFEKSPFRYNRVSEISKSGYQKSPASEFRGSELGCDSPTDKRSGYCWPTSFRGISRNQKLYNFQNWHLMNFKSPKKNEIFKTENLESPCTTFALNPTKAFSTQALTPHLKENLLSRSDFFIMLIFNFELFADHYFRDEKSKFWNFSNLQW